MLPSGEQEKGPLKRKKERLGHESNWNGEISTLRGVRSLDSGSGGSLGGGEIRRNPTLGHFAQPRITGGRGEKRKSKTFFSSRHAEKKF